ncbi:Neuroendocrine 7B2 precursor [Trinorchestia longiramus]|nr:Neuroendocrine 7B2 precursor [Trinorchestia longiramus]
MKAVCWTALLCMVMTYTTTVTGGYLPDTEDTSLLRAMVERMGSGLADHGGDYFPLPSGLDSPSQSLKASLYSQGLPSDAFDLSSSDGLVEALRLGVRRDLRDGDFEASRDLDDDINVSREMQDMMDFSLKREDPSSPYGVDFTLKREDQPPASPYGVELSMHPSLRDREYLQHSHLLGDRLAQFQSGDSYGMMRIKPSGAGAPPATSERKTDGVLPAYCNPPNPCPLGFTASDGCLEEFRNTAAFSRNYQALQECMCDTEHMFDCPDTTRDSEIGALARSIQNEGVLDSTIDKIVEEMRRNPYMGGEKLPVAAKKGSELP